MTPSRTELQMRDLAHCASNPPQDESNSWGIAGGDVQWQGGWGAALGWQDAPPAAAL